MSQSITDKPFQAEEISLLDPPRRRHYLRTDEAEKRTQNIERPTLNPKGSFVIRRPTFDVGRSFSTVS